MKKADLKVLLFFIIGTELVGGLSGLLSGGNFSEFYQSLNQPPFAPPGWLFPVMWTILYALMGISAYQIYQSDDHRKLPALRLYAIQLAVNFLWSIVFFRFRSLSGAVFVILLLLILIILMMIKFKKIRKSAAWLNLPYLLWTAFASYLTIGIYLLNRNA
ncbi:MAG: tryptophan-rich sensory protein [Oscillospiraceae bacterium]|nr:tryptophan-rich sensory protein [Oscillospiraceae bacterium]